MNKNNKDYKQPAWDSVLFQPIDRDEFEIGQCYSNKAVRTIICQRCGGDKFYVGSDEYFTAIKCPKCEYQICIHDG